MRTVAFAILSSVLVLTACDTTAESPAEPAVDRSTDVSVAPSAAPFRTLDDIYADIAGEVPGFGGLYLDEEQDVVLLLQDPVSRDAALGAAIREMGTKLVTEGPNRSSRARVHVRAADYDYRQLVEWYETVVTPHLWGPGVRATDIHEGRNRIVISVSDEGVADRIRGELSTHPIDPEAVRFEVMEPVVGASHDIRDQFTEIPAGVQIERPGDVPCTLGFNATPSDGTQSFVIASHCSGQGPGTDNTAWFQPTFQSGRRIGVESFDPPLDPDLPGCPSGRRCRWSDAVLNQYDFGVAWEFGMIARTEEPGQLTGSFTISSHWPRFEIVFEGSDAPLGTIFEKVGRTTGWTRGALTATCMKMDASGAPGFPQDATLLCQHEVDAGADEGDSGSPVFELASFNSQVVLHGVLWARTPSNDTFFFSPMDGVEADLGSLTTF